MDRKEVCHAVRKIVQAEFPGAAVSTNDDFNPATPIAVTVEWAGRLRKTVRAQKIQIDPVSFGAEAVRVLRAFRQARSGGSVLPH